MKQSARAIAHQPEKPQNDLKTQHSLERVGRLLVGVRYSFLVVGVVFLIWELSRALSIGEGLDLETLSRVALASLAGPAIVWLGSQWAERLVKQVSQAQNELLAANRIARRDMLECERVQKALEESEREFRELYDEAPHAYATVGMDGRIQMANQRAVEVFGYGIDSLVGRHLLELYTDTPNGKEKVSKLFEKFEREGEIREEELEIQRADGQPGWISLTVKQSISADGEFAQRRLMAVDITKRKLLEEALKKSEEAAHHLAKIGRIISSSLNIDDVYESFAREVHKLIPFDRIVINLVNPEEGTYLSAYATGVGVPTRRPGNVVPLANTMTELVMRTREPFFCRAQSPEDLPPNLPGLADIFRAGMRAFINVPLISNDQVIGSLALPSAKADVYTETHVALAEHVAAQIAGAIANSRLHTGILKVEEALRQSEQRYRHLVEEASDVVCSLNIEGYFTYVNPPGARLTGYSQHELIGRHFTSLLSPEWRQRVRRFYARQLLRRIPETMLEFPIITKSGEMKWIEQAVTLVEAGGNIASIQTIVRDVSKRKQIEEERERLITELQEAIAKVKTLSGLLPICASCKKIRDDHGYWNQIEAYIQVHSGAEFSHGICPDCVASLYPEVRIKSRSPSS